MKFLVKRKLHIVVGLSVAAILVAGIALSISKKVYIASTQTQLPVSTSTDPFSSLTLEARAAYALDLSTDKVLYAKNADAVLPLASLTKLVSAYVAEKYLSPDTNIPILVGDDDGLDPGEVWNFKNLLNFTLVVSSNDGIDAIASAAGALISTSTKNDSQQAFVDEMNTDMKSLGLTDMHFFNPSGLDESTTVSGGYGSARDIAALMAYILKVNPIILSATVNQKISVSSNLVRHIVENTDEAIPYIPSIVASKTGYTDLAGGNLAVILDDGLMHPIALVVLGSSYDGRFTDMENLAATVIKAAGQNK